MNVLVFLLVALAAFALGVDTMNRIVRKAETNGSAFGCVRDSNHFGIAGHYAMQALGHDMIGIEVMANPEQKADAENGHELEIRHGFRRD